MINADFLKFSQEQVRTHDIDPVYPYLKHLVSEHPERGMQLILVYMCSYSLGSALYFLEHGKILQTKNGYALTGVERRAHRSNMKMLDALLRVDDDVKTVWHALPGMRTYSDGVREFKQLEGFGRWAAFKLTEILDYVYELDLHCDNLFTGEGSGHARGLERLTGLTPTEHIARSHFEAYQMVWPAYKYQNFETSLCDWNSLCSGHYYAGHDIDLLRHHLEEAGVYQPAIFEGLYPGYDVNHGRNPKELNRLYIDKGVIEWWK